LIEQWTSVSERKVSRLQQTLSIVLTAAILAFSTVGPATANSLQEGLAALSREDYVTAAAILGPLAEQGDARAQGYLGFMYATGRGVPQNYFVAARWYHRGAEQGDPFSQYQLGLLFDKGQGVPEDWIAAHKWLNLATSRASRSVRQDWARIRDAVAYKMSLGQLAIARALATEWRPRPER
jgi:uncharacterized protein